MLYNATARHVSHHLSNVSQIRQLFVRVARTSAAGLTGLRKLCVFARAAGLGRGAAILTELKSVPDQILAARCLGEHPCVATLVSTRCPPIPPGYGSTGATRAVAAGCRGRGPKESLPRCGSEDPRRHVEHRFDAPSCGGRCSSSCGMTRLGFR